MPVRSVSLDEPTAGTGLPISQSVLEKRYVGIIGGAIGTLLAQISKYRQAAVSCVDTADTVRRAGGYCRYRRGKATLHDVEHFLARAFERRGYHAAAGSSPVVIAMSPLLAFAKDIDTRAELEELLRMEKKGTAPFPQKKTWANNRRQ